MKLFTRILLALLLVGGAWANEIKSAALPLPAAIQPDPKWTAQTALDAKEDRTTFAYDGITPDKMVCDATPHELPDGSWILFMLAGGDTVALLHNPNPKHRSPLAL